MGRLKYYETEEKELKELGFVLNLTLTENATIKITKKLSRHFKFIEPEVYFYGKIDYGYSYNELHRIKVAHNPTIGTLIHELGHQYLNQQPIPDNWGLSQVFKRRRAHTKKLLKIVKRFAKYIMKKNYWIKGES